MLCITYHIIYIILYMIIYIQYYIISIEYYIILYIWYVTYHIYIYIVYYTIYIYYVDMISNFLIKGVVQADRWDRPTLQRPRSFASVDFDMIDLASFCWILALKLSRSFSSDRSAITWLYDRSRSDVSENLEV